MKIARLYFYVSFASVLFLASCKPDEDAKDLEKPVIELETPGDDTFHGLETIYIKGIVKDNEALGQLKLEIHEAFDGHSHMKKQSTIDFAWDSIVNLSGTSSAFNLAIVLPEDVTSGKYHLAIFALDVSGNEADFVERELELLNGIDAIAPAIMNLVTTPAVSGGKIDVKHGDNINISADIADNMELDSLYILLEEEATHEFVWKMEAAITGVAYSLNETKEILSAWPLGEYELIIRVKDKKGNRKEETLLIEIAQ